MKPERAFIAERALARHCPELLREGPAPEELLPALAALAEPLARAFARALAPLTGGELPEVGCSEPRRCRPGELDIAGLAANSLLAIGGAPVLLSIEAAAVLRLIDRAFGGRGEAPSPLPDAFPLSAELLVARLEALAANCIASTLEGRLPVASLRRDGSLARLAPFAEDAELAVLSLDIAEADGAVWRIVLAVPLDALPIVFAGGPRAAQRPNGSPAGRDPIAEPFGAMPLSLSAVLVDMPMPVSALSALRPGQVLPVSVARSVPLRIGGRTMALGAIGALDDRVAIQITQAF